MKTKNLMVPLILVMLIIQVKLGHSERADPLIITDIEEDGYIQYNAPDYVRVNDFTDVIAYETNHQRGYIEYDISSIPENATFDRVLFKFRSSASFYSGDLDIHEMENRPSTSGNSVIFADAINGSLYYTTPSGTTNTWYTYELDANATSDLQSRYDADDGWFALGFNSTNRNQVQAEETAYDSQLIIYYHLDSDYTLNFLGPYYENGTSYGTINVTAHLSSDTEEFTLDETHAYHSSEQPIMFSFPVGEANMRRIYYFSNNETFYVLHPYDDYADYEFSVKDYTGKSGLGTYYVEAYRVVNGTERLVERMKVISSLNPVPMTLQYGSTYHIQILWADGTRYDWGYFIAGVDPDPTLIIRYVTFDQKIHLTYKYVLVDMTRPTDTLIQVDYLDTLDETNWANVTIYTRDGELMYNESSILSEKVFSWAGANETEDYYVTIDISHDTFGLLSHSKYLDAERSLISIPNLEAFGTFGGLNTSNLIAACLAIVFFGAFSHEFGTSVGTLVGVGMLTILTYLGYATYGYDFLAFCWFLVIVAIITEGRR